LHPPVDLSELVDLACDRLGGHALYANDEFFAVKENLLRAHDPVWRDHDYTDRGKWMDGWETRRRRQPGHDFCLVRLGLPGIVRVVVVDTTYFRGNYPEHCAVFGCELPAGLDPDASDPNWFELVPRAPLAGHAKNTFPVRDSRRVTHVRLEIFPDGGVARLRVLGEVAPDWAQLARLGGLVDVAALEHGGRVLSASDMFFGSRHNLIQPGHSLGMHDGWETRRRRGPGHDWTIVQLGAPAAIRQVVVDTSHFKGNAPGRCSIEACHAPGAPLAALTGGAIEWRSLLGERPLAANLRHRFADELRRLGRVTHLRLNVMPDGGVARLRAFGEAELDPVAARGIAALNALAPDVARSGLLSCCGSGRFADQMAAARPFEDLPALLRASERTFLGLGEADWLAAFAAHPRLGQPAVGRSAQEQAGLQGADPPLLAELSRLNEDYRARHGFIFILCAAGRSAAEMVDALRARLSEPRARELATAAEEQAAITALRLRRWITEELA
jgi:allantoicase